jgi:hypothetical protein
MGALPRDVAGSLAAIAGPSWDQLDVEPLGTPPAPPPAYSGGSVSPPPAKPVAHSGGCVTDPDHALRQLIADNAKHKPTYTYKAFPTPRTAQPRTSTMRRLPRPVRQRRKVRRVAGPRRTRKPGQRRSADPHDLTQRAAA